jgi:hypothetical protein
MISAVTLQQLLGSCSTDAYRQSSIHFSSIFHLLSSSLKTSSSSLVLRNGARDVPLVLFSAIWDFRGGAASVFLARQQEDPHYKERCTLALFFLSGNGQQLSLLVQRGVLGLL